MNNDSITKELEAIVDYVGDAFFQIRRGEQASLVYSIAQIKRHIENIEGNLNLTTKGQQ